MSNPINNFSPITPPHRLTSTLRAQTSSIFNSPEQIIHPISSFETPTPNQYNRVPNTPAARSRLMRRETPVNMRQRRVIFMAVGQRNQSNVQSHAQILSNFLIHSNDISSSSSSHYSYPSSCYSVDSYSTSILSSSSSSSLEEDAALPFEPLTIQDGNFLSQLPPQSPRGLTFPLFIGNY